MRIGIVCAGASFVLFVLGRKEDGWKMGKGYPFIFQAPLETACLICLIIFSVNRYLAGMVYATTQHKFLQILPKEASIGNNILPMAVNIIVWFAVFALFYWAFICILPVFTMKKKYFQERSLIVAFVVWVKNGGGRLRDGTETVIGRIRTFLKRQYDALLHLDFQDKTNRTIFRIVGINFVIVFLISLFGVTGIWAFALYSVVLFVFLRRYFRKIQEQYKGILKATRALAKGKLDEPLTEDVGIFAPVQEELRRIQHGFQKAVKEEVKSERTKTELITNVSHDLKTPLTAIITYIDLVRTEQDEAKRKEYIDVLERKSLRLKVLIEDLFEISKATSRSATLQYMKIDIVDLLKQVCLEYESDLQKAELEMRFRLPDTKIIVWLDSQKTYRIFENLIVNISKYSMPHTRVYISMTESEDNVRIVMKNISQEEITFDTEEITDRFVRGDASRNTEGSGLGLAIAKSFVELQHGSLRISAEADLFKAEITLPKTDPSSLLEKKA